MRTVGEVAQLTGVSVRTLHHYDEISLLSPSGRSEAGYRLYSYEDLTRLQEILVWRQLSFSLGEIRDLLDDPEHDRLRALRRQREMVVVERARLGAVLHALDATIDAAVDGTRVEEVSMFEGFDHSEYEAEARERWGHTDAYAESARRTAGYGDREWALIRAEGESIVDDFASLMRAGEEPSGERARAVAERHRQHLSVWFYECSFAMHRGLAEMYVADARFAGSYESVASGLAQYVHDAVVANAAGEGAPLGGAPG
jgi:DNA-binding transcriptional MerR regulator